MHDLARWQAILCGRTTVPYSMIYTYRHSTFLILFLAFPESFCFALSLDACLSPGSSVRTERIRKQVSTLFLGQTSGFLSLPPLSPPPSSFLVFPCVVPRSSKLFLLDRTSIFQQRLLFKRMMMMTSVFFPYVQMVLGKSGVLLGLDCFFVLERRRRTAEPLACLSLEKAEERIGSTRLKN